MMNQQRPKGFADYIGQIVRRQLDHLRILFSGSDELTLDRANHLRSHMPIALFGSLGTSCALYFLLYEHRLAGTLAIWLWLSFLPAAVRLGLMVFTGIVFDEKQVSSARHFLRWFAIASFLSGLQYGLGWLSIAPLLSVENQYLYLLAIIALLFGGLHTYSPHFISYVFYSSAAIGGALIVGSFVVPLKIAHANLLIGLVYVLSTMFAMAFSLSFSQNRELLRKEESLLGELKLKHAEALAANSAKSRFLATVSHDLRQPMHAVSLYVATISRVLDLERANLPGARMLKEQIGQLSDTVSYLTEMFEALLDMSRLEAGTAAIELAPVRLQAMLDRLANEHAAIAEKMALNFSVRSSVSMSSTVVADARALERLLRNLISNALRHTHQGGVRLTARPRHGGVELRVIDTGVGIERLHHEAVFREFMQIKSHEPKREQAHLFGNTFGLGLAIAQRLALRMGSEIHVHSWPGVGSVFSLWLPITEVAPLADTPPNKLDASQTAAMDDLLIVLIDDDIKVLESTRRHLESYGATVVAVPDGASARRETAQLERVPDVLVSDYRLQTETGVDVIHALREEFNHDIPALIVTGESNSEHLQRVAQSEFPVLFKPLKAESLVAAIRAAAHHNTIKEKSPHD